MEGSLVPGSVVGSLLPVPGSVAGSLPGSVLDGSVAGSVLPLAGSVAGSLAPVFGSVAGSLLTGSCAAVSVYAAVANPVVSDVSASPLSSPAAWT